jgi:hypothetical protein
MLAMAKRNIICDCKQWWAKQSVKDIETWLELYSETLKLFQEELFAKEQEADGANTKTKEAAAALEVANLNPQRQRRPWRPRILRRI